MGILGIVLIIFYIFYLLLEKIVIKQSRESLKYIIHVNGIRGKSSVTRLIWAGIFNNYRSFCKTTGTKPIMIFPDKKEKLILRLGKANIKEQIKMMKICKKNNVEVAVIECMALKPSYQEITTNKILYANISVITNIRHDHTDIFGDSLDEIASALSYSIPKNGKVIITDKKYYEFFKYVGEKRNSEVFLCDISGNEYDYLDITENVKVALFVCDLIGVKKEVALNNMEQNYIKDPGSYKVIEFENNIFVHDLLAVNDPDSLNILFEKIHKSSNMNNFIFVINNRKDRILRLEQLIDFTIENKAYVKEIYLAGSLKPLAKKMLIQNNIDKNIIKYYKKDTLKYIEEDSHVIAMGNIKGFEGFVYE